MVQSGAEMNDAHPSGEHPEYPVFIGIPRGETGIRTPEPLWTVTRFPGVPLQPLEHLSFKFPWLAKGFC